ncbi:hypothetical protein ACLB2K_050853 [Fragaria x ananassa]
MKRCGRCVASQSALGWGDSLLSVAGRCPSESVRTWLARLSLCGESVRPWLATVSIERCGRCVASQSALGWGDSLLSVAGRCPGESVCAWLARLSLCGESVRAWLATVAIERCGRCVMQGLSSSSHNLSIKERTASEGRPGAPAFDPPMPKSVSRCR